MKFVSAITFLLAAVSAVQISKDKVATPDTIPGVNAHCRQTTDQRTDPTGHLNCVVAGCEIACKNEKAFANTYCIQTCRHESGLDHTTEPTALGKKAVKK